MSRMMLALKGMGILIGGNNIIRAQALAETGGYDTSIIFYGEDTTTARKISKKGRIVFSPSFVMPTSARRFQEEGTLRITALYLYHFFKAAFKKDREK